MKLIHILTRPFQLFQRPAQQAKLASSVEPTTLHPSASIAIAEPTPLTPTIAIDTRDMAGEPVTEETRRRSRNRRRRSHRREGDAIGAQGAAIEPTAPQFPDASPFGELTVSGRIGRALEEMGYVAPTPIQRDVIPLMLAKRDVVGQAQTGTGKTAAFGIPLVESLDPTLEAVQAIVLVPTRELAMQVSEELKRLSKYSGHRVVTLYGGQPIIKQFAQLEPVPQIIVGTPGRVLDHLGRGTLRLDAVRVAVLDEADEMLDIGFAPDMERILRLTPRSRQTSLFSATLPGFIVRMINKYMRDPVTISVVPETANVPEGIRQVYYEVADRDKAAALRALLQEWGELPRALIFCRMQVGVDRLTAALRRNGHAVEGLHGGMTQAERTRVMTGFRSGKIQAVIATNVAARGLDIPDVTHIVSYDAPQNVEEYIHRTGRTGRMGREGLAITFFGEGDFDVLDQLKDRQGDMLQQERSSIYDKPSLAV